MPKRIVEFKPDERKVVGRSVFHSYRHLSRELWQAKLERQDKLKTAREEAQEWHEEIAIRQELIQDVLQGRLEFSEIINWYAHDLYRGKMLNRLAYELMQKLAEAHRQLEEQKAARTAFLESYRYWDMGHPSRKRKWWR